MYASQTQTKQHDAAFAYHDDDGQWFTIWWQRQFYDAHADYDDERARRAFRNGSVRKIGAFALIFLLKTFLKCDRIYIRACLVSFHRRLFGSFSVMLRAFFLMCLWTHREKMHFA